MELFLVPVPATAFLIQGFDLKIIDISTELVTPTGAALLTTLGTQVKQMSGSVKKIGYSCGTKRFEHHPNILSGVFYSKRNLQTTMMKCI